MTEQEKQTKKKGDHLPNKLSWSGLKNLPDGWHADGGNLYLFVRGAARSWVFRYTSPDDNKRRNMGLGSLEAVSLARARELAKEYRSMVKDPQNPIDPIAQADIKKAAIQADKGKQKTFSECAEAYLDLNRSTWANKKHAQQWENTLKTYAYPHFGDVRVSDVETGHISSCLLPIWKTKTETATRLRGRIEKILDWAKVSGYRDGENPALWKGHLDQLLPKPASVTEVVHHPALPYEEIGAFLKDLRTKNGLAARALEFTILTAARSGEVRGATWSEVDLNKKLWTIPAERMKMRRKHEVPLSDVAIAILSTIPRTTSPYIFPGAKVKAPMSDMTLSKVIRRMGRTDITVHGFRSSFRDWAAETTAYPREVCEMALAHAIESETEAAYRRGKLLPKRTRLMADWAAYCDKGLSVDVDNVTSIRKEV